MKFLGFMGVFDWDSVNIDPIPSKSSSTIVDEVSGVLLLLSMDSVSVSVSCSESVS